MTRLRVAEQSAVYAVCGLAMTVIWWAGGHHYYWPVWFWLGAALVVATFAVVISAGASRPGAERRFTVHAGVSLTLGLLILAIWGLTRHGHFWPAYPLVAFAFLLAIHAIFRFAFPGTGRRELTERVDELTRTRRGALDVQDAQLRKIERDLHDGAQARLVALTMQLGRAQEQSQRAAEAGESPPDLGPLLDSARTEAQAAIAELRDLARGIAPPLLADRGLGAAVQALGQRSVVPVNVEVTLSRRPPAVIENAAYFIAAESLTNAAKHAPDATVKLNLRDEEDSLVIDISDNGPGGAEAAGGGLTGLKQRVAALDGTMRLHSPAGHGTWIHVELPCQP